MTRFYVVSGREPVVLVDEAGDPAHFDSLDDALEAAASTPMCMQLGYVIIECDDNGVVGAHDP